MHHLRDHRRRLESSSRSASSRSRCSSSRSLSTHPVQRRRPRAAAKVQPEPACPRRRLDDDLTDPGPHRQARQLRPLRTSDQLVGRQPHDDTTGTHLLDPRNAHAEARRCRLTRRTIHQWPPLAVSLAWSHAKAQVRGAACREANPGNAPVPRATTSPQRGGSMTSRISCCALTWRSHQDQICPCRRTRVIRRGGGISPRCRVRQRPPGRVLLRSNIGRRAGGGCGGGGWGDEGRARAAGPPRRLKLRDRPDPMTASRARTSR